MTYSKRMTKYGTRDCCCGEKLQRNDISWVGAIRLLSSPVSSSYLLHIALHCLIPHSLPNLRDTRVECWCLLAYFRFLKVSIRFANTRFAVSANCPVMMSLYFNLWNARLLFMKFSILVMLSEVTQNDVIFHSYHG